MKIFFFQNIPRGNLEDGVFLRQNRKKWEFLSLYYISIEKPLNMGTYFFLNTVPEHGNGS